MSLSGNRTISPETLARRSCILACLVAGAILATGECAMAGTGVACILIFPAAFTPLLLGLHDYKNLARRDDSITGDYYPDLMHYEIEETVGEWITHWFVSSLMIALLCAFPVAAALWALAQ